VNFSDLSFSATDAADILVTAILLYYFLLLIRGTRAVQIGMGLGVLLLLLLGASWLHLLVLTTLLQFVLLGTAVTLPIVFQPELRRILEQLGRGGIFALPQSGAQADREAALAVLARVAVLLSRTHTGALIAIEQATGLRDFVESGTRLDARLSPELLLTIFTAHSPLHDGAVIVKDAMVEAAGCFLPLTENLLTSAHMGTRHRAAIGLSEQTDAVVLVVSEQTGGISVAREGRLSREIDDEERLRRVLLACCRPAALARAARLGRRKRAATRVPPGELAKPSV
jgi:diadenylate cyclase